LSKIFIEDTEIFTKEKSKQDDGEHIIKDKQYIQKSVIHRDFMSSIFEFPLGEKVLISKVQRFSKDFYKFVLFCDFEKMAWNLIEVSTDQEIRIKRLDEKMYFLWTKVQISFCNTKPSGKVEEWTTNFSELGEIHFEDDHILLSYIEGDRNVVASYGFDGKLIKTHFEGKVDAAPATDGGRVIRKSAAQVRVKKKLENCG